MRKAHDWHLIQRYYDLGHDPAACRAHFHIAYGAWAMAVRRGRLLLRTSDSDGRRRHDWRAIQNYYDEGRSLVACMGRFRFCRAAWHKAVKRGEIAPRPLGKPLSDLLLTSRSRNNLKRRLLQTGILENRCAECGLTEWLGERLTIQIDHINGVRSDDRLENLRMLCPNCHSQTPTYGGRNLSRAGVARAGTGVVV
jgi:HNH endonuclease